MSVLTTPSDFSSLAWSYFQQASQDGIHHAELFFDPQAHTSRSIPYTTVISGFSSACKRAEKELGITTLLTSCFLRHLPVQESLDLFKDPDVQESYRDGTVTGIGLDSSERAFPPDLFAELYERAGRMGLNRTAHAGEEGPAAYIATAIDRLGVERIDHGIALPSDPHLLRRVAASKMMLTVCPLSNVVLRCVDRIEDVPIRKLLDAGVRFSINSDDPAYFGGYCLDNYVRVQEAFQLRVEEWAGIVRAGIEGSWCGEGRKADLVRELERVVAEWRDKLA
jgi:adenosine deaminase